MANFKQTNPSDNPQPGDADYSGPYPRKNAEGKDVMPGSPGYDDLEMSDAEKNAIAAHAGGHGPRFGLTGVDKPHGGGALGLEQDAASRKPFDPSRQSGGNPNNPNDRNNPDGTDARAERAQRANEGNTGVSMAADDAANLKDQQREDALRQQGVSGKPEGQPANRADHSDNADRRGDASSRQPSGEDAKDYQKRD